MGYFSHCKDWLGPVRPVFSRSSDFKNCQRPKTGPRLRSLPVPKNLRSHVVWSWSGLGFLPVLGPDFQALMLTAAKLRYSLAVSTHLLMPQFGSELRFEPEPAEPNSKFSSRFRDVSELNLKSSSRFSQCYGGSNLNRTLD